MTKEQKTEEKYTLQQLCQSKRYAGRQDLLMALLLSDKTYSISETDTLIQKFMKGKVG